MWTASPKRMIAGMRILSLVPLRTGLPSSAFVRLHSEGSKLWFSLNAEIAGSIYVKGEGSLAMKKPIYIDRALLFPFILGGAKYRSKKPFTVSIDENKVRIIQGRRKASFQYATEGSGYFDTAASAGGVELPLNPSLIQSLKVAAECAVPDQTVPELNCVMIRRSSDGIKILASNQLIVFSVRLKGKIKSLDTLPFPIHLVPFLDAEGIRAVHVRKNDVLLRFDCGTIWQSLSVKAKKDFPFTTLEALTKGQSKKKEWPERFQVPAYKLGAVIDRLADYLGSAKKEEWDVRVHAEKGDKLIVCESLVQQAKFVEKLAVESPIGSSFSLNWPLGIMLPVFRYLEGNKKSTIHFHFGPDTPCLLKAGRVSMVVAHRQKKD